MEPADATASDYVYHDRVRHDILNMVPDDGTTIGSIGCGTAATEAELVKKGRHVHGVDTSDVAIALAAPRITSARVIQPSDTRLFEPAALDGLILADVIEHIPNAGEVLKSFAQYVKPGGWVVISVPNMRSWDIVQQFFMRGDWPEHDTGIYDRTHFQMMSHKRLARWCEAAGLKPEKWFDKYDESHPRRNKLAKLMTVLSFGKLHTMAMYQIQVRARRVR